MDRTSVRNDDYVREHWKFAPDIVQSRLDYLCDYTLTCDKIIREVVQSSSIANACVEMSNCGACWRPLISFTVCPKGYDLFLNHVNGYRASYARGPESGQEANKKYIDSFGQSLPLWPWPLCLENKKRYPKKGKLPQPPHGSPPNAALVDECLKHSGFTLVDECLKHPDAKIWNNSKVTQGTDYIYKPEIQFPPWMCNAKKAERLLNKYAQKYSFCTFVEMFKARKQDPNTDALVQRCCLRTYFDGIGEDEWLYQALFGIRAFKACDATKKAKRLVVKGAFVSLESCENGSPKFCTLKSPEDRACQLFKNGWT